MSASVHSFFKNLRWGLYQSLESQVHDLLYLFWEATRQCNLSCRHCGSDCTSDGHPGLPAERVLGVLKRIADVRRADEIVFVVTGGEPLVRPDLLDVLAEVASLGFHLGMVTNGIALDESRAHRLRDVGMGNVVVSLDGPKSAHDWLRNRDGAYERASRAIRALVEAGIPSVEAITCVTPRSLDLLEETYGIVKGLGAHAWRVFNIFPAGRAKGNPDLILTEDQIVRLVEEVARLRERGTREGLLVNLSEEGYLGWDFEGLVRDQPYFCRAGINIAGILADGTISACPNLPEWMGQGNILEHDFLEVWEEGFRLFRDRSWTRQGHCVRCPQWRVCRGNSLHLWRTPEAGPAWCHYEILHPDFRK